MLDFKKLILAILPDSPITNPSEGDGEDLFLDGFAEVFNDVYEKLREYGKILSAKNTTFLELLERELGIIPNSSFTEEFRKNYAHSVSNKVLQYGGKSNIDEALLDAGFTDLHVFNNDPPIDLTTVVSLDYLCYLGDTNAYLGEPTAMCSSQVEGFYIINYWHEYITYNWPTNENLWPFVFILAKAKFNWPIITATLISLYKASNIILYHDYRHETYEDYSGNENDGVGSPTITLDTNGANLNNYSSEKISVIANNDVTFSAHDFSVIAKIDGVYHDPNISFAALLNQSGVHNISDSIEINSIARTPDFRYSGDGATADSLEPWLYGEILEDTGTPLTDLNQGSPCLGLHDDSFICTNDGYEYTDGVFGDITTEDFTTNLLFKVPSTTSPIYLIYKFTTVGFRVFTYNNQLYCTIDDGGAGSVSVSSAALTPGQWVWASIYMDRSGSGAIYINGLLSGSPVVISGHSGSLTNTCHLCVGSDDVGASSFDSNIAYVDLRMYDAWLDTHLQTALALELFHRVIGIFPQYFDGSVPTITADNNTTGCWLEKYNGSEYELHRVSRYWIRYEQILDSIGVINGIRVERGSTNLMDYSYDFSTWTTSNCSVSAETEENPILESVCYSIIPDSGTNEVHIRRSSSAGGGNLTNSIWVKPGTKDWVKLYFVDDIHGLSTRPKAWFNITTGEIGDTITCKARIKGPYNNGFYRLSISSDNLNLSHEQYVIPVDANGDDECTGNGSDKACYVWGAQVEQLDCETSYIATNGATASRTKDSLSYNSASIIDADLSMSVSSLIVPQNDGDELTTYDTKHILTLSGSSGNTICEIDPANDRAAMYSYSDVVSEVTGTLPLNDGDRIALQFNSVTQNGKLLLNNVIDIEVDDATDPYNDHDTITIGADVLDANQFGGLIKNIIVHKEQLDKQIIGTSIVDNRQDQNDQWFLSAIGQKIFLKLKDQFCSVGDFVDDAITTVGFSVTDNESIEIYVDGYIVSQSAKLYDSKVMEAKSTLSIGNNNAVPNDLSFDGILATIILLDVPLTDEIMLDIYNNSLSTTDTFVVEPGAIPENQLDRLKKVILTKKPLGTWCMAFILFE